MLVLVLESTIGHLQHPGACVLDLVVTLIAYFTLFEAHLRYGITVWGKSSAKSVQRTHISILYIQEVILYATNQNLTRTGQLHYYNTRHGNNFILPNHRLSLYEEKPSYMGPKLFNCLPIYLKKISRQKHFKRKLQEWLLEWSFYSIKEFTDKENNNIKVKKRQQRVCMILDSKNITYEVIDITEPGKEAEKEFMQQNSDAKDAKHPLPPQIFNGETYCGLFSMGENFRDRSNDLRELAGRDLVTLSEK
ncbi:hypothetical protein J6590_003180 [Homalodisca vitripennis]|nr:hypothetical protein J6590_003180 [Homalodisca vitripennis]